MPPGGQRQPITASTSKHARPASTALQQPFSIPCLALVQESTWLNSKAILTRLLLARQVRPLLFLSPAAETMPIPQPRCPSTWPHHPPPLPAVQHWPHHAPPRPDDDPSLR
jgi:hypothetical protein